jgi:hypothetical protein
MPSLEPERYHIEGKLTGGTQWVSWKSWESREKANSELEIMRKKNSPQDWMRTEKCTTECEHSNS